MGVIVGKWCNNENSQHPLYVRFKQFKSYIFIFWELNYKFKKHLRIRVVAVKFRITVSVNLQFKHILFAQMCKNDMTEVKQTYEVFSYNIF